MSTNDNKRIQSSDLVETYAYGTRRNLLCKKEDMKCDNITKQYKKWLTLMTL